MSKYQIFQCGPCRLFIEENYLGHNHPFWTWKLDPYRCNSYKIGHEIMPETQDITIGISKAEIHTIGSLLSVRSMGFFELKSYLTDGGYVHRYVRKSNNNVIAEWYESRDMHHYEFIADRSQTNGAVGFEILGRILEGAFEDHGVLLIHGALVEYNGKGFILSAPSQTGKTTHARLWRDYKNALIVNGDVAAVYKNNNIWYGFGLPWSGSSGEQINRHVPISAIVFLEQSKTNGTELINGLHALKKLLPNCRYPFWIQEKALNVIDMSTDLLNGISKITLKCRPDKDAVECLYQTIFKDIKDSSFLNETIL